GERDVQQPGYAVPEWIGAFTEEVCGGGGDTQGFSGRYVRKGIVRNVVVGLGNGIDMRDLIAMPARIIRGAARPEASHLADHRPAVRPQPVAVVRGQIVLPLRD